MIYVRDNSQVIHTGTYSGHEARLVVVTVLFSTCVSRVRFSAGFSGDQARAMQKVSNKGHVLVWSLCVASRCSLCPVFHFFVHPHPCHCRVTVPRILCPFTSPTRAKKERSFPSSTNGCSGRSKWGSNPHPYDQSIFRPSKPSGIRHAQVPLKGHL